MPKNIHIRMDENEAHATSLLELPAPCRVAVMQRCCTANGLVADLASAARSHSMLHQAAVAALSSIQAYTNQKQLDSLLLYLDRHGQHITSLQVCGDYSEVAVSLRQLPPILQLSSLCLSTMSLQLQPGDGFQGVLAGLPLTQLRLEHCKLVDGSEGLAAALEQLPGLEHLSVSYAPLVCLWRDVLTQLQQLTYLELNDVLLEWEGDSEEGEEAAAQPSQSLTRLVDLRLESVTDAEDDRVCDISWLLGAPQLTRLELSGTGVAFEPGVLADKRNLQHLTLQWCIPEDDTAGVEELLSQLRHQQQLTHLQLHSHALFSGRDSPPAAAFSALTASTQLQHLHIGPSRLPAGALDHLFPADRQLPNLLTLDISACYPRSRQLDAAPQASRLVSCCPGLQSLNVRGLRCTAEQLAALTGLSSLTQLKLTIWDGFERELLASTCQLTGLRQLILHECRTAEQQGLLLQLTRLQHLTSLTGCVGPVMRPILRMAAVPGHCSKAPGPGWSDQPVWRQLLQHHLKHSDPAVAQQAAAALAASDSRVTLHG